MDIKNNQEINNNNLAKLCRLIVDKIKTSIKIHTDNFEEYKNYIEREGIDKKAVFEYIISKETLTEISEIVKFWNIPKYKL